MNKPAMKPSPTSPPPPPPAAAFALGAVRRHLHRAQRWMDRVDLAANEGRVKDNFAVLKTVMLPGTRSVAIRCLGGSNSAVTWVSLNAVEVR